MILLWGSNAREAHPIFFHHLLKGLDNGARMYCVDPRYTSSAQFSDVWVGIDVGTDIALANGIGREIIHAGLANQDFIDHSTQGFEAYAASVEPFTPDAVAAICGIPAEVVVEMAHAYATAEYRSNLVDPGHHRAPQRGGQRAVVVQSGFAHRSCGSVGVGAGAAAGSEQRAGRGRHGGHPQQVPRFRQRGRPRPSGSLRGRLQPGAQPGARLAPHADVRGHGAGRPASAVCDRREPRRLRGRRGPRPSPDGRPGHPGGAGHSDDPNRRDGRCGAARLGGLGGE